VIKTGSDAQGRPPLDGAGTWPRLEKACNHASHVFWPKQISLLNKGLIRWELMLGPRQITDSYLLALAVAHGGRFVSFDQRIRVDLVPDASQAHLAIIELP
jgi:predicted nucleic acid-binding protein